MNPFSAIKKAFSKLTSGLRRIFSDANIAKAERIAEVASQLAAFALPYVERFAALTPNTTDDELVVAAAQINRKLSDILAIENEDEKRGVVLGLLGRATKNKLLAEIRKADVQEIKLGGLAIRVPSDINNIAGNLFDLAVQGAYSLFLKNKNL